MTFSFSWPQLGHASYFPQECVGIQVGQDGIIESIQVYFALFLLACSLPKGKRANFHPSTITGPFWKTTSLRRKKKRKYSTGMLRAVPLPTSRRPLPRAWTRNNHLVLLSIKSGTPRGWYLVTSQPTHLSIFLCSSLSNSVVQLCSCMLFRDILLFFGLDGLDKATRSAFALTFPPRACL